MSYLKNTGYDWKGHWSEEMRTIFYEDVCLFVEEEDNIAQQQLMQQEIKEFANIVGTNSTTSVHAIESNGTTSTTEKVEATNGSK